MTKYKNETADIFEYNILLNNSRDNRKNHTEAEKVFWEYTRKSATGRKFRRQHIIDGYIVDFICLHNGLIVEIDGKYHYKNEQMISDEERTHHLESLGYHVVRFDNDEVLCDTQNVIKKVQQKMSELENKPITQNTTRACSPPPFGEGQGGAAIAVDAACSGNPGPMEYRGVYLRTGQEIFHYGPVHGTNNIGEFLALVHGLALLKQKGLHTMPIYSDSVNAQIWVKKKKCKTTLARTPETEQLHQLIARAEAWLRNNTYQNPIIKWPTEEWGEIPADFGRK